MRIPAEWERQSGVQLTWPHADTAWYELDKVHECYARIASAIMEEEQLIIVARDIEEAKESLAVAAEKQNLQIEIDSILFYESPLNDTWARDHGGISVFGDDGSKHIYDFTFNGWGLKFGSDLDNKITSNIYREGAFKEDVTLENKAPYVLEGGSIDVDGKGTLLTTKRCLLSQNRNEYMSQEQIETYLKENFGFNRILWLENGEIIGDDTDSHIDTLARFCSEDTIAYAVCEDDADDNYASLHAMEAELRNLRTAEGEPYNLIPLPLSEPMYLEDYRLPASYANFLILNKSVLMPGSGSEKDKIAAERLQEAFPDRQVKIINCLPLLSGHGSLHCVTMQYPEGFLQLGR